MIQEELLNIIDYIEDKDMIINPNWYYHAANLSMNEYKSILLNGIQSAFLRKSEKYGKTNGKFYVCVAKNLNMGPRSLFNNLMSSLVFILDENLKTLNMSNIKCFEIFENTILPFRYCDGCKEEGQVFLKIDKSKIIALQYSLKKWSSLDFNESHPVMDIKFVQKLVYILNELNFDLPFYDFSSKKEINKRKVLELKL